MKREHLLLVVASIFAVVIFAACTSSGSDDQEEAAAGDASQEQMAGTTEGMTVAEKQIQVGPITVECQGEGPQTCLLVREHEMDPWENWYYAIEAFEHEEGFLFDLLVEEQTLENPPAGGSSIKWVLKEELERTPVEFKTLIVGPGQAECTGEGLQMCFLVKYEPDGEWQYFYSNIERFTFEPGYEYELVVAEIPVKNPPQGASSIQYLLVEEVGKIPVTMSEEPADLDGTIWEAATIYGKPVVEDSQVLLGISTNRIAGSAGCNTFFGPYKSDGGTIEVGPLSVTRKMCPESLMGQESAFLQALDEVANAKLDGDTLIVFNGEGEEILTLHHVESLPLEETPWEVMTINDGQNVMVSVLPDTFVSANFKDGEVSGSAGCNNYFGNYKTSEDSISIGPLASTMMMCLDPVNEQERMFLAALESAATYQIIANRLEIINGDGALAVMFRAAEAIELPGTSWMVNSYNNGRGGVTSVLIGTELTVLFDEESVGGSSGCNNFSGSYSVDEQSISFGPLASTRKMCSDPEGVMEQEQEFLAALQGATSFSIQNNRMDMYFEDGARAVVLDLVQ